MFVISLITQTPDGGLILGHIEALFNLPAANGCAQRGYAMTVDDGIVRVSFETIVSGGTSLLELVNFLVL